MIGEELAAYLRAARSGVNLLKQINRKKGLEEREPPQPPDTSEDFRRLRASLMVSSGPQGIQAAPVLGNPTHISAGDIISRTGVDAERLAWQEALIRGELWLLEGHLKNNCIGCGGDLSCCFKHSTNVIDAARETLSMTTDPLYREAVELAEGIQPFVHPDHVSAGTYVHMYPGFVIAVSEIRTQFEARVMANARPGTTKLPTQESYMPATSPGAENMTGLLQHLIGATKKLSTELYLSSSFGELTLAEAHQQGLVTATPDPSPSKKVFSITVRGRDYLASQAATSNPGPGAEAIKICQRCNTEPAEHQKPGWLPLCQKCSKEIMRLPHKEKLAESQRQWDIFILASQDATSNPGPGEEVQAPDGSKLSLREALAQKGLLLKGKQVVADPANPEAARAFVASLRDEADKAEKEAVGQTESKARILQQNARAARRDADRIEGTIRQTAMPRLVGPIERRPAPDELEFFADSRDQIDLSISNTGLSEDVGNAFGEAIQRVQGAKS